jgi:cystathionine beta-lyase
MKFNTKVIHGNQHPDPTTGAVMPPIYNTSTYAQKTPGVALNGYEYSRSANPTRTALENALASIENGARGLAFSSGLAATDAVMKTLNPGDEVIATDDLYGGTYRMFTKIYENYGIRFYYIDMTDLDKFEKTITNKTKLVWLETPTNPLMKLANIAAIATITKKHNLIFAVDNTFATPYLQKPLDLGADLVMHSATKYLGGHSDVMAGALIAKTEDLGKKLHFAQFATGGILGPQDCFLVLRGIKTLHVRMQRHAENGMEVAEYLDKHPLVNKVFYPGLAHHTNHGIAKTQMKGGFGGMVSFSFKTEKKEDAVLFLENLKVITLAESLGGIESLANLPALMSHAAIPEEKRIAIGITNDLIRLSIGIEDIEDIIEDIAQAFDSISPKV